MKKKTKKALKNMDRTWDDFKQNDKNNIHDTVVNDQISSNYFKGGEWLIKE